jgi:hypothetical protein
MTSTDHLIRSLALNPLVLLAKQASRGRQVHCRATTKLSGRCPENGWWPTVPGFSFDKLSSCNLGK